jgi:hypothetical protein
MQTGFQPMPGVMRRAGKPGHSLMIVLFLLCWAPASLLAAGKPLLSEAIDSAFRSHGVTAAVSRFEAEHAADPQGYVIDGPGLSELARKYLAANDFEAAGAVGGIAGLYIGGEVAANLRESPAPRKNTAPVESAPSRTRDPEPRQVPSASMQAERSSQPTASIIRSDVAYSAVSLMEATNPGGSRFRSEMKMFHAPGMTRYESVGSRDDPVRIYRYDKGVIWLVHPEQRGYEGVKLYQEFPLTTGMGLGAHLDQLMRARRELDAPKGLVPSGQDTVEGRPAQLYERRARTPGGGDDVYRYWVSPDGLMVRMEYVGAESRYSLLTRTIQLGPQAATLFVPPDGYKKAGNRINWKEEKRKLDAED